MALTELQMPTKDDFYRNIRNAASEMNQLMHRWADLSEFIGFMDTTDLDSIGVPAGNIRTDLNQFRIVIEEVLGLWEGNPVTPTNNPSSVIDKIRRMT